MTQNSGRSAGVFLRPEPSETGSGTSGNVVGILEEQNDHKRHAPGLPESRGITHPYSVVEVEMDGREAGVVF